MLENNNTEVGENKSDLSTDFVIKYKKKKLQLQIALSRDYLRDSRVAFFLTKN